MSEDPITCDIVYLLENQENVQENTMCSVEHKDGYINQFSINKVQDDCNHLVDEISKSVKMTRDSPAENDEDKSTYRYKLSLTNEYSTLDPNILDAMKVEVKNLAASVDNVTRQLNDVIHNGSALTYICLETFKETVYKTCDAVDINMKFMYQLIVKCEKLSKIMEPVYGMSQYVKEIMKLLDELENASN